MNLSWLKILLGEAKTKLVLIEDGAQELGSEIIAELNIEHIEPAKEESHPFSRRLDKIDYFSDIGSMSATKLQAFVDCPKKFEEIYLPKIKIFPFLIMI